VSAGFGLFLTWVGATRPHRWALQVHIATAAVGAILLAVHLYSRARNERESRQVRLAWRAYASTLTFALLFPAAALAYYYYDSTTADRIVNPLSPPSTMDEEGGGPNGPFFPSSSETTTGATIPSNFFMTSDTCKRCHEDIYNQWFSSAHHFSSFNNQWYRKSIEYMQDVISTKPSKWCGGCHDHAVIFNGMMDTPIKEIVHTPEAQAGLACTSCHSIVHVKSSMGNGDFVIEYPPLHDLAASDNKFLQKLHDFLVRVDPEPHKKVFMKPFVRKDTAQFCSSCHKVHLDVPVNNYRWFRGFNEYDNWQASGVSGQGARSFYYPPKPQKWHHPGGKLVEEGAHSLKQAELLAILIGAGVPGRPALAIANAILDDYVGLYNIHRRASLPDLVRIPGLGPRKAARILAAVELGRRLRRLMTTPETSRKDQADLFGSSQPPPEVESGLQEPSDAHLLAEIIGSGIRVPHWPDFP